MIDHNSEYMNRSKVNTIELIDHPTRFYLLLNL